MRGGFARILRGRVRVGSRRLSRGWGLSDGERLVARSLFTVWIKHACIEIVRLFLLVSEGESCIQCILRWSICSANAISLKYWIALQQTTLLPKALQIRIPPLRKNAQSTIHHAQYLTTYNTASTHSSSSVLDTNSPPSQTLFSSLFLSLSLSLLSLFPHPFIHPRLNHWNLN